MQPQDLLHFTICGSVNEGKSTLIGRLLRESQPMFDDPMAGREQGMTIDVAYRFFVSTRRKYIVANTPCDEQYTRNMVTGTSTADVAVLLVDARQGLFTQTRRHAYLASLMGIHNVVLAVNKMDLVGFDAATFSCISDAFEQFAKPLSFKSISAVPVSALRGDNITQRSANTPWYAGPTLMGYLETVQVKPESVDHQHQAPCGSQHPGFRSRHAAHTQRHLCLQTGQQQAPGI